MRVSVRNMVCPRCIKAVERIARECGLEPQEVVLGSCGFESTPDREAMSHFASALEKEGFEMLLDKDSRLIQSVKDSLVKLVYESGAVPGVLSLGDFLQTELGVSYSKLRKIFSSVEGRSVENYYLALRVERAKELIRYDELSLGQIADLLGYSSTAHLSAQFKQITGLSPREFKSASSVGRKSIDNV